jgi:hypothetical protein
LAPQRSHEIFGRRQAQKSAKLPSALNRLITETVGAKDRFGRPSNHGRPKPAAIVLEVGSNPLTVSFRLARLDRAPRTASRKMTRAR